MKTLGWMRWMGLLGQIGEGEEDNEASPEQRHRGIERVVDGISCSSPRT